VIWEVGEVLEGGREAELRCSVDGLGDSGTLYVKLLPILICPGV